MLGQSQQVTQVLLPWQSPIVEVAVGAELTLRVVNGVAAGEITCSLTAGADTFATATSDGPEAVAVCSGKVPGGRLALETATTSSTTTPTTIPIPPTTVPEGCGTGVCEACGCTQ
jgi:hypothetical protein